MAQDQGKVTYSPDYESAVRFRSATADPDGSVFQSVELPSDVIVGMAQAVALTMKRRRRHRVLLTVFMIGGLLALAIFVTAIVARG